MASIGLGIAQGNQIYDEEVKRREELDRFMKGRALHDLQQQAAMDVASVEAYEASEQKRMYDEMLTYVDALKVGDDNAFMHMSDTFGLGYEYDEATDMYTVNGSQPTKLNSTEMLSIMDSLASTPMQSRQNAVAGLTADAQFENELAKLRASSSKNGTSSGSGEPGFKDMENWLAFEEMAAQFIMEDLISNYAVQDGLPGYMVVEEDGDEKFHAFSDTTLTAIRREAVPYVMNAMYQTKQIGEDQGLNTTNLRNSIRDLKDPILGMLPKNESGEPVYSEPAEVPGYIAYPSIVGQMANQFFGFSNSVRKTGDLFRKGFNLFNDYITE